MITIAYEVQEQQVYFKEIGVSVCDEATPKSTLLVGSPGGKILLEKVTDEGSDFQGYFKEVEVEVPVCAPKSTLLVGSPGIDEILLKNADELGVHFLSTSGSHFTVGEILSDHGPIRVRRLFQEARQCAPSIIFIDEIDAIWQAPPTGSEWFSDLSSYS